MTSVLCRYDYDESADILNYQATGHYVDAMDPTTVSHALHAQCRLPECWFHKHHCQSAVLEPPWAVWVMLRTWTMWSGVLFPP